MLRRVLNGVVLVLSLLALGVSLAWLYLERNWSDRIAADNADSTPYLAFTQGAIGLETLPVKYAAVIGQVSPDAFATGTELDALPIWDRFGFLPNQTEGTGGAPACVGNAAQWLPYGFNVTNYLPLSAAVTPLEFAGLTCATCHSGHLLTADGGAGPIIDGMGNQHLDVIAFGDGVRNAVLDPALTVDAILDAYDAQCGNTEEGDFVSDRVEAFLLGQWLNGFRAVIAGDTAKYDQPYHGADLLDSRLMPAGPGRTRPFRSVVRVALDLPGADNFALSKIPVVFEQDPALRPRSQYDGSIADPVTRSLIAAYASGASLTALAKPEMESNIRQAAAYTQSLGLDGEIPAFSELFPGHAPDPDQVAAGLEVYRAHCQSCHGYRASESGPWIVEGDRLHTWEFLDPDHPDANPGPFEPIGTDPERLTFRYASQLPLALWTDLPGTDAERVSQQAALDAAIVEATDAGDAAGAGLWSRQQERLAAATRLFRSGHPLAFGEEADGTYASPLTAYVAYYNNPIPRAYLRAPYLHNGSIPTLRQLINLDPRPDAFCRGANAYNPVAVGLDAPVPVDGVGCTGTRYFLYDTNQPGNSNAGHNYPWRTEDPDYDPERLEALLAYLKTL